MGNPKQKWTDARSNIDLKDKWRNLSVAHGHCSIDKSKTSVQTAAPITQDAPVLLHSSRINASKWEIFLLILVIYTGWASPFEFGFLDKPYGPLSIVDNIVNGFFAIDIVLNFLAYLDKQTYFLVDDHRKTGRKYATLWLVLDVVSTIPSELACNISPKPLDKYGLFNMLRLWRLRRVGALFSRMEKNINFNYSWIRCLKLICVTLFAVHCSACVNYLIAAHYHDPSNTWIVKSMTSEVDFRQLSLWIRYVSSIYWSITTLTIVCYRDLDVVNAWEMIFGVFYMLFNLGLTGYLIGNITNLVARGTWNTRKFRDTIQVASSFGHRNQLPAHLQDQMLSHLDLKFQTKLEGLQQQEVLDSLPKAIRSSILHFLFYSLLDQVYLFRGVSSNLRFQLVSEMKVEYFPPREDVILQNEAPTDFYILARGTVEMLNLNNGIQEVIGEAKTGELCGEIGVFYYRPQIFTVRTKTLTQILRINRATFLNIVQTNARDGTIIMNNLLKHLEQRNHHPIMKGILVEIENMLAHGKIDVPLTLCFAALRGYDLLLKHLLKRGFDPNESESDGRTPLHIAASKGNDKCVLLVLKSGANPNIKDSEGNLPLWEAILGGHKKVIKLLSNHGANLCNSAVGIYSCIAVKQNNLELLKEIVFHKGNVTWPNFKDGCTALHVAVCEGNIEIVKFLLHQGARIDVQNEFGWTPRDLAEKQDHEDVKELVRSFRLNKQYSYGFINNEH